MSETLSLAFAFTWLLAVPAAQCQDVPPDVVMKTVSGEVIAEILKDKAIQAGEAGKIAALVEAKIVPHFDLRRMTQLAVGRSWRGATPDQQERLMHEFKSLLVRTYSGALASYRDQAIEFRPLRAAPGDTEVTVKSLIRQSGTEPIAVEYDLARVGTQWKIFDVRIGGISLVATYRSSFADEVRNNGVDGLIGLLERKNRQSQSENFLPRRT